MLTPVTEQEIESLLALLQADIGVYRVLPAYVGELARFERDVNYYKLIALAAQALFNAQNEKKIPLKQDTLQGYIEFVEVIMPAVDKLIALFSEMPAAMKAEHPILWAKPYGSYLRKTIANFSQANLFNQKLLGQLSTYPALFWQPVDGINAHFFGIITSPHSLKQRDALHSVAITLIAYLDYLKKEKALFTAQNHEALLRLISETNVFYYEFKRLYPYVWMGEHLAKHVKTFLTHLNKGVSPTIMTHPSFFHRRDIHDRLEPLASATVLAFDWDDTLCNKSDNRISEATQDLLKLIHEFDFYTMFIITARNGNLEKNPKKIEVHILADDTHETIIDYKHPAPLKPVLEANGLTHVFHADNTVFCNFERYEVVEEGVLKCTSPAQWDKHSKNSDYHTTITNKTLTHGECIIFDDSVNAWEQNTSCGHFFHINNTADDKRSHIEYALGMTFAQTLLHNTSIALEKRQLFAAQLVHLFEKHGMSVLNTPRLLKLASALVVNNVLNPSVN